ncbi:MAG: SDR family NAD(P)-dependent oxidoreductase [Gammaproteobacteria bacterium]|nr:SDR family NAD(P)-dependent oxidoreductase [Gammaproteobacteria bacterium]MBQ0775162.1 SDR family NAD(P)-dependent oxidoreductase [Gammaproteobacteria bacterium]
MKWNNENVPDQTGRVAVITGANSGIGLEAARQLAGKGAHVVLACRNEAKANAAMDDIRTTFPDAQLSFHPLNLASQKHVRMSATALKKLHPRIDLLINNAGVMWLEEGLTEDGYDRQFGTNHLGHFTFTLLLRDCFANVDGARVVTVSSLAHRGGKIHFENPTLASEYGRHKAYCQSKLANLMFAIELNRQLQTEGNKAISVACHPGGSNTNLAGPGISSKLPFGLGSAFDALWGLFTQSAAKGALPTLFAATAENVAGGDYYGPDGPFEAIGYPKKARARHYARDAALGKKLWELSERLTGASWSPR